MKAGLLISASIAAALLSASACAEPSFEAFREVCVATDGKLEPSLAVADAKGWKPIPKANLASFPSFAKGAPPPVIEGRYDGDLGSLATLKAAMVAGKAPRVDEKLAIGAEFCVLAIAQVDQPGLKAAMAEYAAVPAISGLFDEPDMTAYAWRDGPEGRRAVTRTELESPTAPGAKILVAQGNARFVLIGLLTATK